MKLINDYRIKIFTRSFSLELYKQAKGLFEDMGFPCVRLTDQTADGYFYTMLQDTTCDIAINIDEDAFVINPQAILQLVDYVVVNNYANAGCPDGGGGCPRAGNPIVTNPFFNILNLKLIRSKFDINVCKQFKYETVKEYMITQFPKEILFTKYDFNHKDYEPYYPFFFWLAYNFKTLYLHSQTHNDGTSTMLYNQNKDLLCYHSWFARFYNISSFLVQFVQKGAGKQKQRIDNLIVEAYNKRNIPRLVFSPSERLEITCDKLIRWSIKIPQRVANWPNKWEKWYIRYK